MARRSNIMQHADQQDSVSEWNSRAQNHGLHAVFTKRWSEDECQQVDRLQQENMFLLLGDLSGKVVLDLGCGIGRLSGPLSKRAGKVIGVDASPGMLHRARSELPSVEFVLASAHDLPFPDASFDVVVACYVLQHILDDAWLRLAICSLARVAKPGGLTFLMDGTGSEFSRPSNSHVTVIRTWEEYHRLMSVGFRLLARESLTCVQDAYTLSLWKRR